MTNQYTVKAIGPVKEKTSKAGNPFKTAAIQFEEHTEADGWADVYLGKNDPPKVGDKLTGELKDDPQWGWKLEMERSGGPGGRGAFKSSFDTGLAVASAALTAASNLIKPDAKMKAEEVEVAVTELADSFCVYLRRKSDKAITQKQRGLLFKLLETKAATDDAPEAHIRDLDRVGTLTKEKAGEYIDILNGAPAKPGKTGTHDKPDYDDEA